MATRAAALLCVFLASAPALAGDIPVYRQPPDVTVDIPPTDSGRQAMCSYFERIDSATWRTEGGATLPAQRYDEATDEFLEVTVRVPPSNIDDGHAFDLFWSLEGACPHLESVG